MWDKLWLYSIALALSVCFAHQVFANDATNADDSDAPIVIPNIDLLHSGSRWEVSVETTYGSETEQNPQVFGANVIARQSFMILPLDIRYQANPTTSLSLRVPYLRRQEELGVADQTIRTTDSGLGDIAVGMERAFKSARMSGWDGLFGLSLRIPTGKSVYDNLSENELPMGIGHYETSISLGYRRLADPVIVNAGLGVSYILPRGRNGEEIRPGFGFTVKTGIGYALSDRWIVTEELEFTRHPNVFLQSALTAITETVDQAYITHGFVYNRSRDSVSYSLRFSVGLNNQSTDFMVTFGADH